MNGDPVGILRDPPTKTGIRSFGRTRRGDFLRVWTGDLLEYEWGSTGDPQGIRQRKRGSGLLGRLGVGVFGGIHRNHFSLFSGGLLEFYSGDFLEFDSGGLLEFDSGGLSNRPPPFLNPRQRLARLQRRPRERLRRPWTPCMGCFQIRS